MSDSILIYSGLMFVGWAILMATWDDDCECKTRVVITKLKRKNRFRRNKGEQK